MPDGCRVAGTVQTDAAAPANVGASARTSACACAVGAWTAEGALAKIGPSDGQVFDNFAEEHLDI